MGKPPVSVRQLADGQQAGQCQIAFVSASERKLSKALLQAAQGASVLTVGESEGFTANGGVIDFKLDGEKVRIEINTAAADRAKLHISAKLLSLAQAGKHSSSPLETENHMTIGTTYRNLPVKQKLRLIVMVTVTAALLFACAVVLGYDRMAARESMRNDMQESAGCWAG